MAGHLEGPASIICSCKLCAGCVSHGRKCTRVLNWKAGCRHAVTALGRQTLKIRVKAILVSIGMMDLKKALPRELETILKKQVTNSPIQSESSFWICLQASLALFQGPLAHAVPEHSKYPCLLPSCWCPVPGPAPCSGEIMTESSWGSEVFEPCS